MESNNITITAFDNGPDNKLPKGRPRLRWIIIKNFIIYNEVMPVRIR